MCKFCCYIVLQASKRWKFSLFAFVFCVFYIFVLNLQKCIFWIYRFPQFSAHITHKFRFVYHRLHLEYVGISSKKYDETLMLLSIRMCNFTLLWCWWKWDALKCALTTKKFALLTKEWEKRVSWRRPNMYILIFIPRLWHTMEQVKMFLFALFIALTTLDHDQNTFWGVFIVIWPSYWNIRTLSLTEQILAFFWTQKNNLKLHFLE